MKQLFIAWVTFIRRPDSMQDFFQYELCFVDVNYSKRIYKPIEYAVKTVKTWNLLRSKKPDILWIQLAPTLLLYIAVIYKYMFNKQLKIVADCHNSMMRPPWITMPFALRLLNRCDAVLVHNHVICDRALENGVKPERTILMETRPAKFQTDELLQETVEDKFPRPWVLFPCSFDRDEPIKEALEAAEFMPEVTLVITGHPHRAEGRHDLSRIPGNVRLAGFLPKKEFNRLLLECDLVMGLTTRNDTQLSVANEATGAEKPMVISDTPVLRSLFGKGAVYVKTTDSRSIADGWEEALRARDDLKVQVRQLNQERNEKWMKQALALKKIIFQKKDKFARAGAMK